MLKWLKDNYKKILIFCENKYNDYPEVCDRIVIITSIYLKSKFKNENVFICMGEYKGAYHWWMKIEDKIIDLVKFQFTTSMENYNSRIFDINFDIVQNDINFYNEIDKLNIEFNNDFLINNYDKYIISANNSNNLEEYLTLI